MTEILNKSNLRDRRRELRRNSTKQEQLLWQKIRNNQLGVKFRRQSSAGGYVFDFCCARQRLAIEIDGGVHNKLEQRKYDNIRSKLSSDLGFKILRFTNTEVEEEIDKVIDTIKSALKA